MTREWQDMVSAILPTSLGDFNVSIGNKKYAYLKRENCVVNSVEYSSITVRVGIHAGKWDLEGGHYSSIYGNRAGTFDGLSAAAHRKVKGVVLAAWAAFAANNPHLLRQAEQRSIGNDILRLNEKIEEHNKQLSDLINERNTLEAAEKSLLSVELTDVIG